MGSPVLSRNGPASRGKRNCSDSVTGRHESHSDTLSDSFDTFLLDQSECSVIASVSIGRVIIP